MTMMMMILAVLANDRRCSVARLWSPQSSSSDAARGVAAAERCDTSGFFRYTCLLQFGGQQTNGCSMVRPERRPCRHGHTIMRCLIRHLETVVTPEQSLCVSDDDCCSLRRRTIVRPFVVNRHRLSH